MTAVAERPARAADRIDAVAQPPAGVVETVADELLAAAQRTLSLAGEAERWSAGGRRRALESIDRATGVLAAARARLLSAEHAAGTWALHGDRDLTAWRARTSRAGVREAVGQVRQAEALSSMDQVVDALTTGAISTAHVDQIARFTATTSPAVAEHARTSEGQAAIVALATRVDGVELGKALTRWQAELDPAARQRTHDRQQAARYLNLSETPDGTHVKGLLDSIAGHRLRLALEAVTPRPAPDDERTSEQRRADALTLLADRALDDAPATGPVNRPHVSLVLTEPTWQALRTHRPTAPRPVVGRALDVVPARDEAADPGTPDGSANDVERGLAQFAAPSTAAGDAPALMPAVCEAGPPRAVPGGALEVARSPIEVPPVCDEDGRPWPASEVARVLCDCHLTRVVVDADSVPVDLGRTQRLFSAAQRRAVTVRDGGCAWPSCSAPARWCELHHVSWWDRDGGATDLANAVALCSFHHHQVHRRDLTITRERPARRTRADRPPDGRPPDGPRPPDGTRPPDAARPPQASRRRTTGERPRARYRFTTPDGRDAITLRPPG